MLTVLYFHSYCFVNFYSCCSHAQVLGTTIVHAFHIHHVYYMLSSQGDIAFVFNIISEFMTVRAPAHLLTLAVVIIE